MSSWKLGEHFYFSLGQTIPTTSIQHLAKYQAHGCVCMCSKSLQSCLTLCDSMDHSLPRSSVHGILQARILELGCHFFLQGVLPTQGSCSCLLCLLHWQAGSLPLVPPGKPYQSHTQLKNVAYETATWFVLIFLQLLPRSYHGVAHSSWAGVRFLLDFREFSYAPPLAFLLLTSDENKEG